MSESILHTVLILLAQTAIAAAISFILFYFGRIYTREYLKSWAYSGLFFAVSQLFIAGLTGRLFQSAEERTVASVLSSLTHSLHIYFLLLGSYQAVSDRVIHKTYRSAGWLAVIVISLLPILYAFDPGGEKIRYALRVGVRELTLTLGFIASSFILGFAKRLRTIGARSVASLFFLYAGAHSYYLFIIVSNLLGQSLALPFFFGVAETVLISCIGMALVIWLLEDERGRLQKINQEMDSFLYSTSHDLRAPIASVLGITNLARLELTDAKGLQYVGMIEERVKKLDLVISDILQLSRSANVAVKYELIDFNKLFADTVADVRFHNGASEIELRYNENPMSTFFGDYGQMKIVLGNLISNAVRYHRIDQPDPFISVRFIRGNRKIVFEVEDNGEGISHEHQAKVFDMFYRASSKADGTGLGLYIVKEALTKVQGSISLESQPGKGTIFRVTLNQQ